MKKVQKRFLALLLTLIMAFSCMGTAFASEVTPEDEIDYTTWTAADFTYGTQDFELYPAGESGKKMIVSAYVVTGLSESGEAKILKNTDMVIPATNTVVEEVDGVEKEVVKKVQGIANNALKSKGITSLTLPANVKAAYDDTTWDTTGKGLTERGDFFIGSSAFTSNKLTTLDLPEGVIYIGNNAFQKNLLTTVTFPKTIMQVQSQAFVANAITTLNFPEITDFAFQADNMTFGSNQIVDVQIPANTEKLHKYSFVMNTGHEKITSGTAAEKKSGVVYIYVDAEKLGAYVDTSGVVNKYILGKMPVPWGVDHFTFDEAGTTVTGLSDAGKEKIKEDAALIIPAKGPSGEAITALGDGVNMQGIFVYADNADAENVKYYAPESVQLPETLTKIGKWTFALNALLTYETEAMTEVAFPEGLVEIGQTAFQNSKLTSVVLPDGVATMGTGAFTGSGDLAEVTLSKNLKDIPQSAFAAGSATDMIIKNVVIPEGVETVGRQAFAGAHIETLTLPSTLTDIGQQAFENHQLTEVEIPGSVASIGKNAFRVNQEKYPGKLTTVILNEGLVTIGQEAFYGNAITEVDLPSTVVLSTKNKAADCIFGNAKTPADPIVKLYVTDAAKAAPAGTEGSYNTEFANTNSHIVVYVNPMDRFVDVPANAYYYDAVAWAVENGITLGKDATHFEPSGSCTRAQVVTFLWRAKGCPEPTLTENPFTDVKESEYYYKAVLWAFENGITTGKTATEFQSDATVTREQVVTFLWRAEGKPAATIENPFTDVADGKYSTEAILWAFENGITTGKTATEFQPAKTCQRCQVVTFLYRAAK